MTNNQMTCLPIGGQPVAVAKLQAATSLPASRPVASFGGMQCRSIGDRRMVTVGRIGGIAPKPPAVDTL